MAVTINVLSTFNDAGLKKARGEMDRLNKKVSSGLSTATKTAGAMGAGVLAGAGIAIGGLLDIGTTFDSAYDSIRANTGKTGDELEALKGSLKTVAATTATSFDDAATVVGTLAAKLGTTGKPLEDLSSSIINLSNITGTDLGSNLDSVSKLMQNFGVVAEYQTPALDLLYRASQNSGTSVTDLATAMADSGSTLRAAGFDFQTSTAFIAQLSKAGIDASEVMPALSRAVADAGKKGIDANTYLSDAFNTIKNAPNDVAGASAAVATFGKKGAKMAELIRSGATSFDDFKKSISEGDTISNATTDTEDFGEKFTKLKNKIMAAVEPIASGIFDKVGEVMDWIGPKVEQVTKYFQEHKGALTAVQIAVGALIIAGTILVGVMAALAIAELGVTWPLLLIIVIIALVIAAVIYLWVKFDWFREGIKVIVDLIWQYMQFMWTAVTTAFDAIWTAIQWLWEKFNWIKDRLGEIFSGIKDAIISAFKLAFNMVVKIWNGTVGGLGFDVPSWVPGIGGKSFKVPELTEWAHTGGIVGGMPGANVPMMLQTGEMVLSQDQQAMLLGRINGGGGGNNYSIHLTVSPTADKAAIGQATVEAIAAYERRSGKAWRS